MNQYMYEFLTSHFPTHTVCSPPDFENGWTDFEMMMIPSGATVNVYCYEGFTNWGADTLTCQSGSLSGEPRCEKVDECKC